MKGFLVQSSNPNPGVCVCVCVFVCVCVCMCVCSCACVYFEEGGGVFPPLCWFFLDNSEKVAYWNFATLSNFL